MARMPMIDIADEDLEILLQDADDLNYRNLRQYLGYLAKARARELRERNSNRSVVDVEREKVA